MRPVHPRVSSLLAILGCLAYSALVGVAHVLPRHDLLVVSALLYGVFRALDGLPTRARFVSLATATVVLLTGALLQLWSVGYEGRSAVVAGVVPWCDSHDYASDALRVLHHQPLALSSKRPFFPVVLAGLLRLTGQNLRVVLVGFTLTGALATALVTAEIWRTRGRVAAFVVYLVLYLFERRWTGLIQTEHLAMPLGCVAFVVLWRKAGGSAAPGAILGGLFLLALALLARPGPFFALPAVLGFWVLRRPRAERAGALASGVGVLVLAFLMNQALGSGLGTGATMSDYPAIAYGMLHEEDSQFLCTARPDVCARPPRDATAAAWRLVASDVAAHPLGLAKVLAISLAGYVGSPQGLFSLGWYNPDDLALERGDLAGAARGLGAYRLLNMLTMAVAAIALTLAVPLAMVRAFRERSTADTRARMLLAAHVGFLASAPFLAPAITPSLQTFAAVLPWVVALPAIVFASSVGGADGPRDGTGARRLWVGTLCSVAACALAVLLGRRPAPPGMCGDARRLVEVVPGTVVTLRTAPGWSLHSVSIDHLEEGFAFLEKHNGQVVRSVRALERPGTAIAYGYDACTRRALMLVDPDGRLADGAGRWLDVEAGPTEDPQIVHVLAVSSLPTAGSRR